MKGWEEPESAHLAEVARHAEPRRALDALRLAPRQHRVHARRAQGADAVGGRFFAPALLAEPGAVREPRLAHLAHVRTGDLAVGAVAASGGEL